ncbi:MAG: Rab family GTPase [Promethearchaeota archaeon]
MKSIFKEKNLRKPADSVNYFVKIALYSLKIIIIKMIKMLTTQTQIPKFMKIIIAGNSNVGKTTLLKRFVKGVFEEKSKMTVGVEHFHKEILLSNLLCKMQLWDLGGQDRFRYIVDIALKGAHGALLLFDITNYASFVAIDNWVKLLRTQNKNLPIILLATKADLSEISVVKSVLIPKTIDRNNFLNFIETSSKTGQNVTEAFEILANHVIAYN